MPLAHTVHEITLKNSARGVIIDVPGTTAVHYEFSFRAGNNYAKRPQIQQVAHLLEHMAFGPNASFESAEAYSQEFSRNGADNNATTSDIAVTYYGNSAIMEVDRILDLWRVSLTQPRFNEELLRVERENIREELEGMLADDDGFLSQRVGRATGSTSLLTEEELATLDAITLDDITEHYARTHTADNMRFVISGALAERIDAITAQLESWELPRGERLALIAAPVHRGGPVSIYRQHAATCSFNISMMVGRQFTDAESDAMAALNYILTGTMHSRIYGEARRRGICYGMGAGFYAYNDSTSEWVMRGGVSERNAEALYELIVRVMRDVASRGVSESELDDAKQSAHGRFQLIGQTVEDISDAYTAHVFYDEPVISLDAAPARIDAVDNDQIVQLAREIIAANAWAFGEIGPMSEAATVGCEKIVARIFESQTGEV